MDTHRSTAVLCLSLLLIHVATAIIGLKTIKAATKTIMADVAAVTETSPRQNTLLDDADDLQRQLDNEARERYRLHPKTSWILHLPGMVSTLARSAGGRADREAELSSTHVSSFATKCRAAANQRGAPRWYYSNMCAWPRDFPGCRGHAQSPVCVPGSVVRVSGSRPLLFKNYDELPIGMTLRNDGTKLVLTGVWPRNKRPSLWGGAAHFRRYLFHAVELHWPSEHRVGMRQFPLELQAVHVAAEYRNIQVAIDTGDPEALLVVSYLYSYGDVTDPPGVELLLCTAVAASEASTQQESSTDKDNSTSSTSKDNSTSKNISSTASDNTESYNITSIGTQLENSTDFGDINKTVNLFHIFKKKKKQQSEKANEISNATISNITYPCTEKTEAPPVMPLMALFPNFTKDYATYAGSQTMPPCKEVVRWIIYSRPLTIQRDVAEAARNLRSIEGPMRANFRYPQPLNDRKIYYFY